MHELLGRLPVVSGQPIRIQTRHGLRDRRGDIHGAAFLRARQMAFDCTPEEFPRIFVHELFHFVWLRSGNPLRRSFEDLLRREWRAEYPGELGWSAEWRKRELRPSDVRSRGRRWREYCCESFCDTAAWIYSGVHRHQEFTLAAAPRKARREWFRVALSLRRLSI